MRRHSRSSAGFIAWILDASIWWTYNLTQPPNCISRMTEETRPEISLLSKQPTLALPEGPTFSFDSQTNQPQRRVYYFDTDKHLYYDSKVMRVLSTIRVAWFSNSPMPSALTEEIGRASCRERVCQFV